MPSKKATSKSDLSAGNCLYLMRSGECCSDGCFLCDYNRPLSKKGIQQILFQLESFKDSEAVRPDCILCSTAVRSRQTVELLQTLFSGILVFYRDSLYLAPVFRTIDTLSSLDTIFRRVMIVGHNPGLENTLSYLVNVEMQQPLKPGDCAAIQMIQSEDWHHLAPGSGQMMSFFKTKI